MSDDALFLETLISDVTEAWKAFYSNDTPYNRRNVARLFGSAVEGETSHLKQRCLRRLEDEPSCYTTGEVALLRECSFYLDRDGSVQTRPQFLSAAENFHFALKTFVKDTLPECDIRQDNAGWSNFRSAFGIRNRITHPATEADLIVTDSDIRCVQEAFLWYRKTLAHTLVRSALHLHEQNERIRSELESQGWPSAPVQDPRIIPKHELEAWAAELDQVVIPTLSRG